MEGALHDSPGGSDALDTDEDIPAQLLRRWQDQRDPEALDELLRLEVRTLAERLRRKAGAQLRPSVSASDLVQEAVFRLLRQQDTPHFEAPGQLRAYLWKSAWRLLLNRLGHSAQRVRRLSEVETGELGSAMLAASGIGEVEDADRNVALELAVNLLAADDRQILDLVYFQHQDIPTAAEQLGIKRGAAEMRLTRARRRLAEKLCDWMDLIG